MNNTVSLIDLNKSRLDPVCPKLTLKTKDRTLLVPLKTLRHRKH